MSVADQGEGPGEPVPLFLDQTEPQRAEKVTKTQPKIYKLLF